MRGAQKGAAAPLYLLRVSADVIFEKAISNLDILYQIAAMDEEKSYNLSHWDCGVHFVPFFSVGVPRFF